MSSQTPVRLTDFEIGCRADLQGKERELEGQRSILQQHEKHETQVEHERDLLNKQHVKAEGAAQKQVPAGLLTSACVVHQIDGKPSALEIRRAQSLLLPV